LTSHFNFKDYGVSLLAVNAGIIGSVFIFFAIAAQVPASTIFAVGIKRCSFGFNLLTEQAQIAVVMVGGIIILLFSLSSVLALIHRNVEAAMATSAGFAVIFVASIITVSSLAWLPTDFFVDIMIVPFIVIVIIVILGAHIYSEKKELACDIDSDAPSIRHSIYQFLTYLSTFLKAIVAKEAKITVEIARASKSVTKCVKFPVIIKALKASTAHSGRMFLLTTLGNAMINQIATFDFLSRNKEYFSTHTFGEKTPMKFLVL
jgi:hypothetical protein